MSPRMGRLKRAGGLLALLFLSPVVSVQASPSRISPRAPRLDVALPPGSIAASETTFTGWDFGYLVEGGFLNLMNTRFTSVSFVITLENLPGTTAMPSSGTLPPLSSQSVFIGTDRSNVPVGEYSGKIRVIYLPTDTLIVPLHYFVADTIFGVDFTPPRDSVLTPGDTVRFGQDIFFTLWTKNSASVTWQVKNSSGATISRNFVSSLPSKGVWEWVPVDDVLVPSESPTVTSMSSMTPTGNPITDDFFSVVYHTTGGLPATTRGDLNGDGFLTAADVVLELNLVFLGQLPPAPVTEGDVNCDGLYSPGDVVLLLNKVFLGSGTLCPP